ncbi:MAG: response regulator [Methylotenera sp.]|nr:response regulator [Oligoflexia bacterium]
MISSKDSAKAFASRPVILHVEDSEMDHEALKRALHKVGTIAQLFWCKNVDDAFDYLHHSGPYDQLPAPRPSLILLDLNLPGENGTSFLQRLRKTPKFSSIVVVVLSSSSNPIDIERCYDLGANAYLLKTLDPRELQPKILSLAQFWLGHCVLPSGQPREVGESAHGAVQGTHA